MNIIKIKDFYINADKIISYMYEESTLKTYVSMTGGSHSRFDGDITKELTTALTSLDNGKIIRL
jgi:hypothetical protein